MVPIALDAPLTCSVIGQFLLARWKSPAVKRWRLFVVTLITAPLSLAGNALHGALRFQADNASLDLALLDLHHPEVAIRLVAAMVPAIGIILAVAVTELVLRERARLEELREADRYRHTQAETEASAQVLGPTPGAARPTVAGRPERDSTSIAPPRRSTEQHARSVGHQASRRSATEVLAMVRSARERLNGELEREPKDEEVASQVSAAGHPITASRVRTYLAQLRAAERTRSADEDQAKEEVVAWRGR